MEKSSATSLCKSLAKGSQSTLVTKKTVEDEDFTSGYPWPPRSYSCTFCGREFKSAQALGGHMNVHRKDRARLRCSPPRRMPSGIIGQYTRSTLINLNLKPNPNPNRPYLPSSPSPLPSWRKSQPSHSPLASSSKSPTFHCENMKWVVGGKLLSPLKLKTLDLTTQMKMDTNSPEDGGMMLDLETSVLGGGSKENIDLELRLGYSS